MSHPRAPTEAVSRATAPRLEPGMRVAEGASQTHWEKDPETLIVRGKGKEV